MGYYSGSGVTTGGSESINPFNAISYKDENDYPRRFSLQQRIKQSSLVKRGVSLDTAQDASATIDMSDKVLYYYWRNSSGQTYNQEWIIPSCKGRKTEVAYSQIADSNLYELVTTTITQHLRVKADSAGWQGWES